MEFEGVMSEMVRKGEAEWPVLVVYPDGTDGEVYDTVTKEWVKSAEGSKNEVSLILQILISVARTKD